MDDQDNNHAQSIASPDVFWGRQADLIEWHKAPSQVRSGTEGDVPAWFADGELNISYLALDYHIEQGRGDQLAVIYDSPVTGVVAKMTYREMRDRVALFAGVLQARGVAKGDRVVIYMPMVPEAVIAMLACARLGAVHSVVFGGFAAPELAARIDDARPKIVVSASCGIEFERVIPYKPLLDEALRLAQHKVDCSIILQRDQARAPMSGIDIDWDDALANAEPATWVPVSSADPLYILYTSGTTGKPKGIVHDTGGYAVALRYSMQAVYDARPGDVFWAASDVGWVVGHSYIVYAPLITGCTTIVFEGKPVRTPDAATFWRVIDDHKVNIMFTAPTAFRAIRKEDPRSELLKSHDISSLRTLFLAGERTDPATYDWLTSLLTIPVIDHWWQTETGWPVSSILMGEAPRSAKSGAAGRPVPGYDVHILDPQGEALAAGEEGAVVVKLPLPPGCLLTVWGDQQRFEEAYLRRYPGFYHTGDGGYLDEDGFLFIMGRTDDVINVAGHRLSTGEMEEIVAAHPAVVECAVVGIADAEKGQVPLALVIVTDGGNLTEAVLETELIARVREAIGAFAGLRRVVMVARLPKTRSGKILRQIIRRIADGEQVETPATIDDPAILEEIREVLLQAKVGKLAILATQASSGSKS